MAKKREVIGATDLGKILGVSGRSVRNWYHEGLMPQPLISQPLRWDRDVVDRWLPMGKEIVAARMSEPRVVGRQRAKAQRQTQPQ